jgi:MoxR-like ATPase
MVYSHKYILLHSAKSSPGAAGKGEENDSIVLQRLKENISSIVLGKDEALDLLLVALLAEGHVLIEDVPGVGKTLITKALAASLHADFHRLQCTPDLTPTDVTGFYILDRQSNAFVFKPGPVVANICSSTKSTGRFPERNPACLRLWRKGKSPWKGKQFRFQSRFLLSLARILLNMTEHFPCPKRSWIVFC